MGTHFHKACLEWIHKLNTKPKFYMIRWNLHIDKISRNKMMHNAQKGPFGPKRALGPDQPVHFA